MQSQGKPLQRKLFVELAAVAGSIIGAGLLASKIAENPRTAKRLALTAALVAPIFFYPRRTFAKRAVVVTGGSRGLGLAIARRLLKQNAFVTLLARDDHELRRAQVLLEQQVPGSSKRVFILSCDVTNYEELETAFAKSRARFGRIDGLFNVAGAISVAPFEGLTSEDFDAQMNLHFKANVNSVRLVRPYLHQAGGGHIVNISSIGGLIPVPHMAAYSASKFALGGFSETMGAEMKSEGIFVTTVYPGLMRTGSTIQAVFSGDHPKEEYAWFATGDNLPGISMSADCAASRIVKAAADGQARLILSATAKLASLARTLVPEIFSYVAAEIAHLLPASQSLRASTVRATGAEVRAELAKQDLELPTESLNRKNERRNNQRPEHSAQENLGLVPIVP